jgi:hypothetical protein
MVISGSAAASRIVRLAGFGASRRRIDRRVFGQRALVAADAAGHAIDLVARPEAVDTVPDRLTCRPGRCPGRRQRVLGMRRGAGPDLGSSGLTPLAAIRTSTWPAAGTGRASSARRNGASGRSSTKARIQ